MAMGKKKRRQQKDLWVATSEMPVPPGHPFYVALEDLLKKPISSSDGGPNAPRMGRPSWNRASTFGCCWWAISNWVRSEIAGRHSLGLREFLGLKLSESPPDHSTLSRSCRWQVGAAARRRSGTLKGKSIVWKPMPRCADRYGIAGKGTFVAQASGIGWTASARRKETKSGNTRTIRMLASPR